MNKQLIEWIKQENDELSKLKLLWSNYDTSIPPSTMVHKFDFVSVDDVLPELTKNISQEYFNTICEYMANFLNTKLNIINSVKKVSPLGVYLSSLSSKVELNEITFYQINFAFDISGNLSKLAKSIVITPAGKIILET